MRPSCTQCGVSFYRRPSEVGEHNFCSQHCHLTHKREHPSLPKPTPSVLCAWCGQVTYWYRRNRSRQFCSKQCQGSFNILQQNRPPSPLETVVASALVDLGADYMFQVRIHRWLCDFYLPDEHLVIEVDGRGWHSGPVVKAKDATRDAGLRGMGLRVARMKEREIKRDVRGALAKALLAA